MYCNIEGDEQALVFPTEFRFVVRYIKFKLVLLLCKYVQWHYMMVKQCHQVM